MSIKLMAQVWERDLPQNEMLVLLALADHADDYGRCFPSIRRIAWKTGYSERSVQRILRTLEDQQIVVVIEEAPGVPGRPRTYGLRLVHAKPKAPFETGDNLTPLDEGRVTPVSGTGDIRRATGDISGATGDIAMTPEPSIEPSVEPSLTLKPRSLRKTTPKPKPFTLCPSCGVAVPSSLSVCPECSEELVA